MTGAIEVVEVRDDEQRFEAVLDLASSVLGQDRYLIREYEHALESRIVAAFVEPSCVGFLRLLIQVIGSEEGRTAIVYDGAPSQKGSSRPSVWILLAGGSASARRCRTMRSTTPGPLGATR